MVVKVFLLFALLITVRCHGDSELRYTRSVSYAGDVLVKCSGLERETVESLMEAGGMDVWCVGVGGNVDLRLSQDMFTEIKERLPGCKVTASVEKLVRQAEMLQIVNRTQPEWFQEYHRYQEIVEWWKRLAKVNELVRFEAYIGKSYEGRNLPAIHITASTKPDVPIIYFQCQIHAREWISGATCMYLANTFVERHNNGDKLMQLLLARVKVVFVPFVNPDGYEYTWTNERLWRKNRRPGKHCYGVDLNRNYNVRWGKKGSSGKPCSEMYRGAGVESEVETRVTASYFRKLGRIVGAIDWHSFSQLILRPYGWTTRKSPDEAQLKKLSNEMARDIFQVHGKTYRPEKSFKLYPTSGTAADWFYSNDANVNNDHRAAGFTVELRNTNTFLLPADQIIPTGEEMVPAVLRFMESLVSNPLKK